jgi:hypothetical protein
MSMPMKFLCAVALSLAMPGAHPVANEMEVNYDAKLILNARLVYEAELKSYFVEGKPVGSSRWPRHIPRNLDAIRQGNHVVLGLHLPDCASWAKKEYLPSECGDEQLIVFGLRKLPDIGESVGLQDESLVAAGIYYGSRFSHSFSGCLGVPTFLRIHRLSDGVEGRPTFSVQARFVLTSHFRFPKSCDAVSIDIKVLPTVLDTDSLHDGGLRNIFQDD